MHELRQIRTMCSNFRPANHSSSFSKSNMHSSWFKIDWSSFYLYLVQVINSARISASWHPVLSNSCHRNTNIITQQSTCSLPTQSLSINFMMTYLKYDTKKYENTCDLLFNFQPSCQEMFSNKKAYLCSKSAWLLTHLHTVNRFCPQHPNSPLKRNLSNGIMHVILFILMDWMTHTSDFT
jgi:hypothetical protein